MCCPMIGKGCVSTKPFPKVCQDACSGLHVGVKSAHERAAFLGWKIQIAVYTTELAITDEDVRVAIKRVVTHR